MTKKDKTPTEGGPAFVTDIQHEEVKGNGELSQVARVMTPEETAQQEIKKFNLADSAIAALKEKYGGLKISGPEDKEGYKIAREAWGEVRTIRTGLTKKGKELRDGYNLISKKIIKEEDRLVELITPLEDELYKTWKAIDEEKERAENERKAAEEKGFMDRLETLQKFGLVLDGGFYSIGETIQLDAATLRSMPEERFLTLKGKAEAIFQEEQRKQKEAEAERLRQVEERKKEAEAYELAKKELAEQRAQMERDREAMENLKRAQEAQLLELRVNKFLGLGMQIVRGNQLEFYLPMGGELLVEIKSLNEYSPVEFERFLEEITNQIKELKNLQAEHDAEVEKEAKERERREKFIAGEMERAGLKYNYGQKRFEYFDEVTAVTVDWPFLLGMSDGEIAIEANAYIASISDGKKHAAEIEKDRQAQAEAERKAGMSDKDLFADLYRMTEILCATYNKFKLKTKAYQKKRDEIVFKLNQILDDYKIE